MIVYASTAKANGTATGAELKLIDDYLRRELRVGDPSSPAQIEKALRARYTQQTVQLDEESAGLAIPLEGAIGLPPDLPEGAGETAGSRALAEAQRHLDADLTALVGLAAARDWVPELSGWQSSLLREVSDGAAAARFAQDAAQRERTFLAIRRLEDYARVARIVGCATPEILPPYRRLATSLDECGSVLRILMGEALGSAGLAHGGMIIQVPVTDARLRRDSLIAALRALIGASADYTPDWGRGPYSYDDLLQRIAAVGAPELRLYLRQPTLAQVVDDLLAQLQRQDPASLRRIASTAPIELLHLHRLLDIGIAIGAPASSPLSAFFQSLQLFIDAFDDNRACARLIDLALPVPLAAMQTQLPDAGVRARLRDLINWRAEFAQEVECYAGCAPCSAGTRRLLIRLDTALHWVDRAIDFLAQGDRAGRPFGPEEIRAGVLLMDARFAMIAPAAGNPTPQVPPAQVGPAAVPAVASPPGTQGLVRSFNNGRLIGTIRRLLLPLSQTTLNLINQLELDEAEAQLAWERLAVSLAPRCMLMD
jgi:hypothetical protein